MQLSLRQVLQVGFSTLAREEDVILSQNTIVLG
jgi:hypothetical protein